MSIYQSICQKLKENPRKWLITGVAGFVGTNLLEMLLQLDQHVVGIDNFTTGSRSNLNAVLRNEKENRGRFNLIEGDIRCFFKCQQACQGVDFILHQGAIASVPHSLRDPAETHEVNVQGTINILNAAGTCDVKKVVYASSSAVYGNSLNRRLSEAEPTQPLSPYASSKRDMEVAALRFSSTYNIPTVGLRYFNVYGRWQRYDGKHSAAVIPNWIDALIRAEPCYCYGDGTVKRDFVSVTDVVQANLLAAVNEHSADGEGRIYNVGSGRSTSLQQLFTLIDSSVREAIPKNSLGTIVYESERPNEILHSKADISKIERALGYAPEGDLRGMLLDLVQWHISRRN